jgi:hypothetical protein
MERAVATYPDRSDFLWAYTRGQEGAPPEETSLSLPYSGYSVMRTGWERDAVWALFDGGPFGYGHQHEDKLNLLLHAYGRLLLSEGGNYAYDDSEMRRYVLSTRSHNTIRVDGCDQNRRLNYRREDFDVGALSGARWFTSAGYDVVEATYDEGYGTQADRSVTHQRKVVMLKSGVEGLGPCLLVFDRLRVSDERVHSYQVLWHLDTERVRLEGLAAHSDDAELSNLSLVAVERDGLAVSVVSGQESPEWQGWKTIEQHQQGQYAPAPAVVYELSASGSVRLVTCLYPTRAGETCPVRAIQAGSSTADVDLRLVLADGRELDLDEREWKEGRAE